MPLTGVLAEKVLTFTEATKHCPALRGKKPARATIYVWCDTGILVNGERVKLECARWGGIRVTSAEALERFFSAISGGRDEKAAIETPSERKKAANKDIEFLRKSFAKV